MGNIWLSDKAYISLDGFVNKQNWCVRETENPHIAIPSFLHFLQSTDSIFWRQTIAAEQPLDSLLEFMVVQSALGYRANTYWFITRRYLFISNGWSLSFPQWTFRCSCHCPGLLQAYGKRHGLYFLFAIFVSLCSFFLPGGGEDEEWTMTWKTRYAVKIRKPLPNWNST